MLDTGGQGYTATPFSPSRGLSVVLPPADILCDRLVTLVTYSSSPLLAAGEPGKRKENKKKEKNCFRRPGLIVIAHMRPCPEVGSDV